MQILRIHEVRPVVSEDGTADAWGRFDVKCDLVVAAGETLQGVWYTVEPSDPHGLAPQMRYCLAQRGVSWGSRAGEMQEPENLPEGLMSAPLLSVAQAHTLQQQDRAKYLQERVARATSAIRSLVPGFNKPIQTLDDCDEVELLAQDIAKQRMKTKWLGVDT